MYNKILALFIFSCIALICRGQVHVIAQTETKNTPKELYDSLTNIIPAKNDYTFLIGQKLFFYADTIDAKDYGGGAFYKLNKGKKQKKQPYIELPYSKFLSKSFEVVGIERYGYEKEKINLKLLDTGSNDTIYFRGSRGIYGQYWTTEGFFKKAQEDFVAKEFYLVKDYYRVYDKENWFYDLETDKIAEGLERGTKLRCIDVAVKICKQKRHSLIASIVVLLFENEEGNKYYLYLEKAGIYLSSILRDRKTLDYLVSSEEMEERKTKERTRLNNLKIAYGDEIGTSIYIGEVELGYTTTMCKEAWGTPLDINTTIGEFGTHEQWVYENGRYLYFENGKLTSIQK